MQQTTNFELSTYESNDIVNVMVVDKGNMEKIDTAMKDNEIASIGVATEITSGNIHTLTRVKTDTPVFRFTATSNFTAGDTFVVDGVQVTALLPDGESLGTGAYIIGSEVLCALRDTLLTVYTTSGVVSVASDSEKLGGELPEYYGTAEAVETAQSTANASGLLAQSVQSQVTTLNSEIIAIREEMKKMSGIPLLDFANPIHTFSSSNTSFTANKECYIYGSIQSGTSSSTGATALTVNGTVISQQANTVVRTVDYIKLIAGDTVSINPANINWGYTRLGIYSVREV